MKLGQQTLVVLGECLPWTELARIASYGAQAVSGFFGGLFLLRVRHAFETLFHRPNKGGLQSFECAVHWNLVRNSRDWVAAGDSSPSPGFGGLVEYLAVGNALKMNARFGEGFARYRRLAAEQRAELSRRGPEIFRRSVVFWEGDESFFSIEAAGQFGEVVRVVNARSEFHVLAA